MRSTGADRRVFWTAFSDTGERSQPDIPFGNGKMGAGIFSHQVADLLRPDIPGLFDKDHLPAVGAKSPFSAQHQFRVHAVIIGLTLRFSSHGDRYSDSPLVGMPGFIYNVYTN